MIETEDDFPVRYTRESLRRWKTGARCSSTDRAAETLRGYGFRLIARFRRVEDSLEITDRDAEAEAWERTVYAFVLNNEIVRIGSSKDRLKARLNGYQKDISYAFAGDFVRASGKPRSTKSDEAKIWANELQKHAQGEIWARQGTQFHSPVTESTISGYQDEESFLIAKHQPRLNRGSHC